MKTIVISGHSDDLVHVDGWDAYDEFGSEDATFVISGSDGRAVRVRIRYDGCWRIEVGHVDEDVPMLPVTIDEMHGYSARATVKDVSLVVREAR